MIYLSSPVFVMTLKCVKKRNVLSFLNIRSIQFSSFMSVQKDRWQMAGRLLLHVSFYCSLSQTCSSSVSVVCESLLFWALLLHSVLFVLCWILLLDVNSMLFLSQECVDRAKLTRANVPPVEPHPQFLFCFSCAFCQINLQLIKLLIPTRTTCGLRGPVVIPALSVGSFCFMQFIIMYR